MATQILAIASGAANSADVTITGTQVVALKATGQLGSNAKVIVAVKDDAGGYNPVGQLDSSNPGANLSAGTYQFERTAASDAVGVFSA